MPWSRADRGAVHPCRLEALLLGLALAVARADAHGRPLPINPALGVPGYPDCRRPASLGPPTSVETAAMELECFQRGAGSSPGGLA